MLKMKIKGKYSHDRTLEGFTYEALCSIILKEYQKLKVWYTVYGCEHQDLIDLVGSHHILNALEDPEEFPVIKLSSLSAALLGVSDHVEPSDLYDVFAHYADRLNTNDDNIGKEPIFTPDIIQFEAVVSRFKWYSEYKVEKGRKKYHTLVSEINAELLNIHGMANRIREVEIVLPGELDLAETFLNNGIAEIISNEYLERYCSPPSGFPLSPKNLHIENQNNQLHVRFFIRGIRSGETYWDCVYDGLFSIPYTPEDIADFIIFLSVDIKKELAGLEKERSKDSAAQPGKYPRKNHSSHGLKLNNIPLHLAEKQALFVIKKSLRHADRPALSSSFGRDSTLVLHLMRRVTKEGFQIVFNNTRCEYAETMEFKKALSDEWGLEKQLITTYPKDKFTFWDFVEEFGWNFERKGNRKAKNGHESKSSRSEICCKVLKHEPMLRAIRENRFDINFTGLRAEESRNRDQAGKRDGLIYLSKEWGCLRANPILPFTNEMVLEYEQKHGLPHSKIYDMILYENQELIYSPRTGCQGCMLTASYGYLKWLKHYKNKLYKFMMKEKGLAETLYRLSLGLEPKQKECSYTEINFLDSDIYNHGHFTYDDSIEWDDLEYLLEHRPCLFEKAIK